MIERTVVAPNLQSRARVAKKTTTLDVGSERRRDADAVNFLGGPAVWREPHGARLLKCRDDGKAALLGPPPQSRIGLACLNRFARPDG